MRVRIQGFIEIIESAKLKTWTQLLRVHLGELEYYFDNNSRISTPFVTIPEEENNFKKFTPLIPEHAFIRCSECHSRFKHKRSYELHFRQFHPQGQFDVTAKDPVGTCRMHIQGSKCGMKLPLRSIYGHLYRIHGIERPSNFHNLIGFSLGRNPRPVFVLKGQDIEEGSSKKGVGELKRDKEEDKINKKKETSTRSETVTRENTDDGQSPEENPFSRNDSSLQSRVDEETVDETPLSKIKRQQLKQRNLNKNLATVASAKIVRNKGSLYRKSDRLVSNFPPDGQDSHSDSDSDSVVNTSQEKRSDSVKPTVRKTEERRSNKLLFNFPPEVSNSLQKKKLPLNLAPDAGTKKDALIKRKAAKILKNKSQSKRPKLDKQNDEIEHQKEPPCNDSIDKLFFLDSSYSVEEDSDWEEDDTTLYTKKRRENKKLRHLKRNETTIKNYELRQNSRFIHDMKRYMKTETISTVNQSNTTIVKTINNLFKQEDSFLNFMIKQKPDFDLENLRNFENGSFTSLTYPIDWLTSTCENDGQKGQERLKSHSQLRRFIDFEVEKCDNLQMKLDVKNNSSSITDQIVRNKLFRKYETLATIAKNKKKKCQLILDSSKTHNEQNIVVKWNRSAEKMKLDQEMDAIYKQAIKKQFIGPRLLTKYSEYARLKLAFSDKNRPGLYSFTVGDFVSKMPCWYPEGYTDFERLPDSWNPLQARDEEPSAWFIALAG